jgi:serine/threonine protein kinase
LNSNANSSDNVYTAHHLHLAACVGRALARLHASHVVHGDLTTSNFMVRESSPREVVVIDFGLGSMQAVPEDKAVDLYVLERAFLATHPGSEPLVEAVMAAYTRMYDSAADGDVDKDGDAASAAEGGAAGAGAAAGEDVPATSGAAHKRSKKSGADSDKASGGGGGKQADSDASRQENCLAVLRRLEDVRMRGRKRDMFG